MRVPYLPKMCLPQVPLASTDRLARAILRVLSPGLRS